MRMDYHALAEEWLTLEAGLHRVPAVRQLSALDKGVLFVLNYLYTKQEAVCPKELSREMAVSTARIATLLHHLEERGLVARRGDPKDNRRILVFLTPEGEECIRARRAEAVGVLADTLAQLGPEDAQAFLRIGSKILRNFSKGG